MESNEIKPLHIWPYPVAAEDREYLISAKSELGLSFKVLPVAAFIKDEQGWLNTGGKRVLCLGENPPMICDHALVFEVKNKGALMAALDWATSDKYDSRATTSGQMLQRLGWREIPATQLRYSNLSKNLKLNDLGKVPIFQPSDGEVDSDG